MNIWKIEGNEAIRIAERDGVTLHKYADPTEGYRKGVTLDEAREIAKEDASLIYCIVQPTGWTGDATGRNVADYFPGSLNGTARSGAKYLGPDDDGIEPIWSDKGWETRRRGGNLEQLTAKVREASQEQRGNPENEMLRACEKLPPGMLMWAVEHVGDLSHRAGEFSGTQNLGLSGLREKVRKLCRVLENDPSRWSWEREVEQSYGAAALMEHMRRTGMDKEVNKLDEVVFDRSASKEDQDKALEARNALYSKAESAPETDAIAKEMKERAVKALEAYAKAHEDHVHPVTHWQALGKQAAVALGRGDNEGLRKAVFALRDELKAYESEDEQAGLQRMLRPPEAEVANTAFDRARGF